MPKDKPSSLEGQCVDIIKLLSQRDSQLQAAWDIKDHLIKKNDNHTAA